MSKMVYEYRHGARVPPIPAQVVGDAIESIEERDGRVTPEAVVDFARSPNSPLHPAFDWNDTTAASSWRVHQARNLIGVVVVTTMNEEKVAQPIRAFVNISTDGKDREYLGIVKVMSDSEKRHALLEQALKELWAWRNRYSALSEFASVFGAIGAINIDELD